MAAIYRYASIIEANVADHELQPGELQARVGGVEDGLRILVDRLGPVTLSPEHLSTVKAMAQRLHEHVKMEYRTICWNLCQLFHVSKIEQLPADGWPGGRRLVYQSPRTRQKLTEVT